MSDAGKRNAFEPPWWYWTIRVDWRELWYRNRRSTGSGSLGLFMRMAAMGRASIHLP
jgi:hypothetical protein